MKKEETVQVEIELPEWAAQVIESQPGGAEAVLREVAQRILRKHRGEKHDTKV